MFINPHTMSETNPWSKILFSAFEIVQSRKYDRQAGAELGHVEVKLQLDLV